MPYAIGKLETALNISHKILSISRASCQTKLLVSCLLLIILIAKVWVVLKNSRNLLHGRHKNFENWFRNSWDTWGQSFHLQHRNYFPASVPLTGTIIDLSYLNYFWIVFQNSCAYHVANFLNFSKLPQLLQLDVKIWWSWRCIIANI